MKDESPVFRATGPRTLPALWVGVWRTLFWETWPAPKTPEGTDVGHFLREFSSQARRSRAFSRIWGTAFQSECPAGLWGRNGMWKTAGWGRACRERQMLSTSELVPLTLWTWWSYCTCIPRAMFPRDARRPPPSWQPWQAASLRRPVMGAFPNIDCYKSCVCFWLQKAYTDSEHLSKATSVDILVGYLSIHFLSSLFFLTQIWIIIYLPS